MNLWPSYLHLSHDQTTHWIDTPSLWAASLSGISLAPKSRKKRDPGKKFAPEVIT